MEFLPVLELIDRLCIARVKHARTQRANQVELDWYERKRKEFIQQTTSLFDEFLNSDIESITQFAKIKNTSQPALTQVWKNTYRIIRTMLLTVNPSKST